MRYSISNFITVAGRRKAVVTVTNGEQSKELFVETPPEMAEIAGTYEGEFRIWQREKDERVFTNIAFHGEQILIEAAKPASVEDLFSAFAPAAQTPAPDFSGKGKSKKDQALPDL